MYDEWRHGSFLPCRRISPQLECSYRGVVCLRACSIVVCVCLCGGMECVYLNYSVARMYDVLLISYCADGRPPPFFSYYFSRICVRCACTCVCAGMHERVCCAILLAYAKLEFARAPSLNKQTNNLERARKMKMMDSGAWVLCSK